MFKHRNERQVYLKGRTHARFGEHIDGPVMLFDDAVHHCKPQTGTLAHFFGGKKGLENMRSRDLVHALARVRYNDQRVVAGLAVTIDREELVIELHLLRGDRKYASRWH